MAGTKTTTKQRSEVKKKWIVDKVLHPSWKDSVIPISVCPITGEFWILCELVGVVESRDREIAANLWRQAYESARTNEEDWERFIVVKRMGHTTFISSMNQDTQPDMYVGFEQLARLERLKICIKTYSKWDVDRKSPHKHRTTLWRPFPEDLEHTPTKTGRSTDKRREPIYSAEFLPYSEDAWRVLCSVRDRLRDLHEELDGVFNHKTPDEVVALIGSATGRPLLTG